MLSARRSACSVKGKYLITATADSKRWCCREQQLLPLTSSAAIDRPVDLPHKTVSGTSNDSRSPMTSAVAPPSFAQNFSKSSRYACEPGITMRRDHLPLDSVRVWPAALM